MNIDLKVQHVSLPASHASIPMIRIIFLLLVSTNMMATAHSISVPTVESHGRSRHQYQQANLRGSILNSNTSLPSSEKIGVNIWATYYTIIYLAANDEAKLYIDGRLVKELKNKKLHDVYYGRLRLGTTISIEASNQYGWGGVVADVNVFGRHYRTGGNEEFFKAHAQFSPGPSQVLWKYKFFSTCSWNAPVVVKMARSQRSAERSSSFPFFFGAQYVWASGVSRYGTVLLRATLGGERCYVSPSPSASSTPIAESTKTRVPYCTCKQSAESNEGNCYQFTERRRSGIVKRKCEMRTCEAPYECVDKKETGSFGLVCIRKFVTHEVLMVAKRYVGSYLCVEKVLRTRRQMLVPYE